MAVSIGNVSSSANGYAAGSLTFSHTANGDLLLVGFAIGYDGGMVPTGVTYGGVAMTRIATESTGVYSQMDVWKLVSPAAGTANVVLSFSGDGYGVAHAVSVIGSTSHGTAVQASTTGSPFTQDVTSVGANDVAIQFIACRDPFGGGASPSISLSDTSRANSTGGTGNLNVSGAVQTQTGSGTVTLNGTLSGASFYYNAMVSLRLIEAAASVAFRPYYITG